MRIDIKDWKWFHIEDLFRVEKGTRLTKADMKEGDINFIGASAVNNGITKKIGNDEFLHPANVLTVNYNGSVGETFYQSEPFWASDDVNVLYPKFPLTQNIALFIAPIIKRIGKTKYQFIDKWKQEDMKKDSIPLPCSPSGDPDWDSIESYMLQVESAAKNKIDILQTIALLE